MDIPQFYLGLSNFPTLGCTRCRRRQGAYTGNDCALFHHFLIFVQFLILALQERVKMKINTDQASDSLMGFFFPKSSDKPTVDLKCKANFLGTESCCPFQSLGRRPRLSRANRNINMILARIQRSAFKNCVPSIHNILPSKSQLC